MPAKVLADLRRRLDPLARSSSPLSPLPPRETRFGSPLVLSRVHWVKPQLVAEITYLTWTDDGLSRQTVFVELRSDKPAGQDSERRSAEGLSPNPMGLLLAAALGGFPAVQVDSADDANAQMPVVANASNRPFTYARLSWLQVQSWPLSLGPRRPPPPEAR